MGKKDKKKGKGAEKTAAKTDKKLTQKMKKELTLRGEDDIEQIVAQIEEEECKRQETVIKTVPPPSPRCNFSFTAHPNKDELILFGGEYYNGQKTFVYKDLYFYNIAKGDWTLVKAPNGPPPRCSHQAVPTAANKGELWVFGGEYASPTQSQFYHYRDLWVYHLADNKWEKVVSPNGPSSRSGHRMVCVKKQLIVFGGFHDNLRDYKYFNDVYAFNLDTRVWTKLEPSGTPPSPRSGCQMVHTPDGKVLIFGGYSKIKVKKDVDKGTVHTDMFLLAPEKNDTTGLKWKWSVIKPGGARYSPRCSLGVAVGAGGKAYTFGGVFDEEDDDEEISGVFYNDLYSLELDKFVWRTVTLSGKKEGIKTRRRRRKGPDADQSMDVDNDDSDEDQGQEVDKQEEAPDQKEVEVSNDGVFKVIVGPSPATQSSAETSTTLPDSEESTAVNPHPRMNCGLAVKHGILYLYGGLYEQGEKQFTFSDLHSLDLHKLDEWKTLLACDLSSQEWIESSSESSESEESSDNSENDEEMDTE